MKFQTHDASAAFTALVQAARVRGHGVEPLTIAAIAYVAQLAIDVGDHDAKMVRQIETDLVERVKALT